jgi:hypothetical protein
MTGVKRSGPSRIYPSTWRASMTSRPSSPRQSLSHFPFDRTPIDSHDRRRAFDLVAFDAELPSPFFGLLDTRAQRRNPATHCHGVGEIDHLPIDTLDLFHQFHVTTLGTLRCELPSHLLHDERREIVGQDVSDLCYDGTVNPSRELLVDEERRESSRRHVANI